MNQNDMILKIQKLLALSESPNEHEARAAMLKAQELLAKHKLTIREIQSHSTSNIIEQHTGVAFRKAKWKGSLAKLIADNFGCYSYLRTHRSHTIVFMGTEEDVAVCKIVLDYALDSIGSAVARLRRLYQKKGASTMGLESDYALGFIAGLRGAFEQQKQENQEWGLVLVKEDAVVQAYNQKDFRRALNTATTVGGFQSAYHQGIKDGKRFSVRDKISRS